MTMNELQILFPLKKKSSSLVIGFSRSIIRLLVLASEFAFPIRIVSTDNLGMASIES